MAHVLPGLPSLRMSGAWFSAGPVLVREALRVTGLGRGLSGGLRTDELAAAPSSPLVLLVFVAALGSCRGPRSDPAEVQHALSAGAQPGRLA